MSQTHTPQYQIPLDMVRLLPERYTTPDIPAVLEFLNAHPSLEPLLLEAYSHIRADFPAAPLFLEIFTDAEWPEDRQLLITISPLCPPPEALVQYRRLQQNWWLAAMPRAAGALALLVEYR